MFTSKTFNHIYRRAQDIMSFFIKSSNHILVDYVTKQTPRQNSHVQKELQNVRHYQNKTCSNNDVIYLPRQNPHVQNELRNVLHYQNKIASLRRNLIHCHSH